MTILQTKWEKGYCLFVDGLVHSNQEITLFTHYTLGEDNHYTLLADTTVDSILKYNEDPWVAIDIFGTVKWSEQKSAFMAVVQWEMTDLLH